MPDTDVKISELEAASSANADDRLEASQVEGVGFASRSITLQQVSDLVAADLPPPVSDWDDITGKPATFPPTTPIPYTDISGTPTALPPNGAAGGDLSGSYPNPLLKPSVTNGQIMTTVGGVSTWANAPASATLPAASVGYGDAGNTLTGVLANMSFIAADRKFGVGVAAPTASIHAVSTTNNQPVFKATGIASSSAAQNWFHVAVVDPTGGSGSSFRIDGGASGALALYDIDRSGDALVSGWQRILSQTALAAGGRYYMGLYIGNGSGGNTGLYAGTGAPTLDTFGTFGSIYMDASMPGLPYYNSNGSTGWTRLVGETATQTLSNKTLASPVFTGDPTAPTPATADNDTSVATTAFVKAAIAAASPALYAETILGSTATQITITFPANCRKVEVEFAAFITGAGNVPISAQLMQSGTPLATGYGMQQLYGAASTAGASTSGAATSMGLITGIGISGTLKLFNNIGNAHTMIESYGPTATGFLTQVMGANNAALHNTITGARLFIPSDTFRAGSWMRSYVVT